MSEIHRDDLAAAWHLARKEAVESLYHRADAFVSDWGAEYDPIRARALALLAAQIEALEVPA